jgi:hypothetical protein
MHHRRPRVGTGWKGVTQVLMRRRPGFCQRRGSGSKGLRQGSAKAEHRENDGHCLARISPQTGAARALAAGQRRAARGVERRQGRYEPASTAGEEARAPAGEELDARPQHRPNKPHRRFAHGHCFGCWRFRGGGWCAIRHWLNRSPNGAAHRRPRWVREFLVPRAKGFAGTAPTALIAQPPYASAACGGC